MSLRPAAGLRGRQPVKPPWQRFAINYLHSYLRSPLPGPAYPIDVSGGITQWQMLGNGPDPTLTINGGRPVGDCTFAGRQHLRMAKAAATGEVETWETTDQLVSEYLAYDHGVDGGANIADVLMHWFMIGKIRGFAPVDHTDPVACDTVMAAFHGLYVGVDLTDSADSQFNAGEPWTLENGEKPDPNDGHCIVKVRADGHQFDTWVTWGALQQSERAWTAACIREAWAVITTEDEVAKIDMPTLLAHIVAAARMAPGDQSPATAREDRAGATAFALGWQMAQLYGPLPQPTPASPADHLPSIAEYDTAARMELGFDELACLLDRSGLRHLGHESLDRWQRTDPEARQYGLRRLHFGVLDALACRDSAQAACYQLGRALSDTCWFPDTDHPLAPNRARVDVLLEQFDRERLATLQGWLGQMGALSPLCAPVASRSLQNWSDWIQVNAKALERDWPRNEQQVVAALRIQSGAWYRLLSSDSGSPPDPSMGAWVHAGESILRNTRVMAAKLLRRFWLVAVVVVAATAGLVYLALADAQGTAKVWATLVTVAASVSVSGAGLRSGAKKLAGGLEQSTWRAATLDAQAWAVTWLPTIPQGPLSRHRLRTRGVAPPEP